MSTAEARRWVIAGGGTGGHVTLALALGEEIAERGDGVLFLGAARGLENQLVPEQGFALVALPARPLEARNPLVAASALLALGRATCGALRALRRFRADLVLSVGGYAAAPVAAAALLCRTPLALVEPNAVPGRANRAVARFARRVFVGFEAAADRLARSAGTERVRVVGVPLRRELCQALAAMPSRRRPEPPFRLLVFGGSQGARQLNDAMLDALPHLDPSRLAVFHQTGAADRERVSEGYARAGFRAEVVAFEPELAERYRWADLALCRAGALSVAELAAAGLPALLVPYPYAADDHQLANARQLERIGAARVLDPAELDGARVAAALKEHLEQPDRLLAMGRDAAKLARPDAARAIVDECRTMLAS